MSAMISTVEVGGAMSETGAIESAVADSTTATPAGAGAADKDNKDKERLCCGQDVLVKHKDGRYYLGTVVEVDALRDQCLVKFGDNTDCWYAFKDLTKLHHQPDEDLLCVVCKKSAPKDKGEVIVCEKCGRGYHHHCHQPHIPPECQKEDSTWICRKCVEGHQGRIRSSGDNYKAMRKENIRKVCSGVDTAPVPPSDKTKLPYDPDLLNWDTYHRVNMEQIYCYCGRNGEWYTQMVQCGRCRQWFHEKCVRCLKYPLYCGDRFYVFVCAVCNQGREFVRRLELKWVDMVHLMLFNLTAFNVKKYYDLDTVIIPYVNDNWHALQLPPKILNVSRAERRDNILSVLTNNRNRFKCGREIKKRTTIWGLRVRLPPPAPCVSLPATGPVTEEALRERWHGNKRLQFLPAPPERAPSPVMLAVMRGTAYQSNAALSDPESPCPSPQPDEGTPLGPSAGDADTAIASATEPTAFKLDFHGGGFVKKSVPFPKMSLQRRKRLLSMNVRDRDKLLRRQKQKRKLHAAKQAADKTKEMRLKKTRRLLKAVAVASATKSPAPVDKKQSGPEDNLPLTPPTSVSAPPTPPAASTPLQPVTGPGPEPTSPEYTTLTSVAQNLKAAAAAAAAAKHKSPELHSLELNTPCDTSGDETSSKSTLDLIIPPPKDFEGKNNPFHALLKGSGSAAIASVASATAATAAAAYTTATSTTSSVITSSMAPRITLPLPLTAVIPSGPMVRPAKRQLSEKDICIGPNGEVKRRRLRRGRAAQLAAYAALGAPTASKTAAVVPARPDTKEWGQRNLRSSLSQAHIGSCVDYALNGRRLRQRQDKTPPAKPAGPAAVQKLSPVKSQPDINLDDLKSSVNIYFGAANRIAAGERFTVKAKRVGPSGKAQYLIEWEGPAHGMT